MTDPQNRPLSDVDARADADRRIHEAVWRELRSEAVEAAAWVDGEDPAPEDPA